MKNNSMQSPKRMPKSSSVFFVPKPAIAFDLDETLISTTSVRPTSGDYFQIRVRRRSMYVRVRPGLPEFLKRIQKKYDVFIFTAAQSDYGNLIIDRIAPHIRECRRFFRDSCVNDLGYSVKDLSVLRTNLKQTLLVDDIAGSALHNPKNLIHVKPWYGEADDTVLEQELLPLLEGIAYENDLTKSVLEMMEKKQYLNISRFPEYN